MCHYNIADIKVVKNKILYGRSLDKNISYIINTSNNKYVESIYKSILKAVNEDWFKGLIIETQLGYLDGLKKFFLWIESHKIKVNESNKYRLFKNYEEYCINSGRRKSPLEVLNIVVRKGMYCESLEDIEVSYLTVLIKLSKPRVINDIRPHNLNDWFNFPWLRNVIGEKCYFQLESPKILISSFRVTVAYTLTWLLDQREKWNSIVLKEGMTDTTWTSKWNHNLLNFFVKLEMEEDYYSFLELLSLDLIKPSYRKSVIDYLNIKSLDQIPNKFINNDGAYYGKPWHRPVFFGPDNINNYSLIEEQLCSWILASFAIQPSDIKNLKVSNFAIERNNKDRLIAIECIYYKGRSGRNHYTKMMMGSDIWTKAVDRYIRGLSGEELFKTKINRPKAFTPTKTPDGNYIIHKFCTLLYGIWMLPSFEKGLIEQDKKYRTGLLFYKAMIGLAKGDIRKYTSRKSSRSVPEVEEYHYLPKDIFGLTHIKTTSVYAESDNYREGDLINYNSHSSSTESINYLTDSNKEWVNQSGRITRLVLNDLNNSMYSSINHIVPHKVRDIELRTKVVNATGSENFKINSVIHDSELIEGAEDIIVLDTIDTAMYFIHYISEVEKNIESLIKVRPDYIEKSILVKIEWMSNTLSRMRSSRKAVKEYKEYKKYLPPILAPMLETIE